MCFVPLGQKRQLRRCICTSEGSTFCGLVKQMAPMRLLFISASQDDEINLLNAGADDWMKKPYKMSVLYARIQALLRMA